MRRESIRGGVVGGGRGFGGGGVAVGVGDVEGAVGFEFHGPAGLVDLVMMLSAHHHEIFDRGCPVGVADHVVGFAPRRGPVTAREAAGAVAHGDDVPQVDRRGACGGAAVQQDRIRWS